MNREYQLKLPLRIRTSGKKVTALNLNVYRNLHFRSLSALKIKFQEHGKKLLNNKGIPPLGRICLNYKVYTKTKREFDIANICSIVDKFFSDTLVHAGIIEDDNWKFLDSVSFGFGGFSPDEYVLVTITEIEPRKGNAMRILLDEDEIQVALENHVFETLGISGATGVNLSADDDGNITAEVLMGEAEATPTKPRNTNTTTSPRKGKGGRPAGSKNKPKEPEENVAVCDEDGDDSNSTGTVEPSQEQASGIISDPVKAKKTKNLFGDEETPSSESDTPEEPEEPKPTNTVKKASIFDE